MPMWGRGAYVHKYGNDLTPIFALRNRLTFLIVNLIVFKECGRFM